MIKKIFLITIFAGLMIAGCTPAMDLCGPSAIEVSNDIILTEEGEFDFFDVTCSTSWVMSGEIPTWMTIDCPSFPVGGMGTTSIKVTMEENNEGDPRFAVFTFLAATGDVATVTVTQLTLGTFAIVQTLTNVTSSNMAATVFKGNTFSTTFSVGSGFVLPAAITVTMGGDVLTNGHEYDYDSATGVLNVSGVTGTVQITVTGIAVYSLSVAVADQSPYGSVDIVTGSATGNISGSTVKVIATPAQFYVFEKWVATDDIDAVAESVNAEYEFVIDANTTLYAVFQGDGTFHGPIQINSVAQMTAFASRVNDGTEPIGRYYILTADLDLGDQWIPIGTNVTNDAAGGFRGYFDGGGHTITINGIGTLEAADIYYVGIFGYLGEGGLIQNLRAEGSLNITQNLGEYHIGGIVGRMNNHATIQNCVGAVDIVANLDVPHAFAGGIVGFTSTASDLVSNCYSTADVSVINSRTAFAGGIVGFHNFGTVIQCYATGEIDAQSTIETAVSSAGGVVGRSNNGYITNCFALNTGITCSAAIPDNRQIGRIVGSQVGEMSFLTNNRAISISGIDTEGGLSANKDGALISASFAEEMSTYQTLASWPFGYDNPAPWAWNSAIINRPILYWEDI